jgi:hypothetical protein
MKQSINKQDFHNAFNAIRPDNFSYEGLNALFEYLEDCEDGGNEQIELDVIAICCEFMEGPLCEILNDYNLDSLESLQDHTTVLMVDDETVVFQQF